MNREHPPCGDCAHFITTGHAAAAARGEGWCDAWEAYKPATGQAGVLFMERGTYETAKAARSSTAVRAELRQREDKKPKTISRASANDNPPQAARAAKAGISDRS
jgi:hypothetical protein